MSALLRLIRAGALDIGPLRRHREFRLLYTGQAVSFAGSMITFVAIPFQVYDLTGSTFVGLLFAAGPAGAFLLTLASGWTRRVTRHGRAVAISAALGGAAVALFGIAGSLPLAIVFLALAGAADMSSGIFRATIWNQTIPDSLRGRLAGIEQLSYSIGPTLGQTQSGGLAALTSVRTSLVAGGALCVAGTIALCALLPRFWRYDAAPVGEAEPVSA